MRRVNRLQIIFCLVIGTMALGLLTWGLGKAYLELVGRSRQGQVQRVQTDTHNNPAQDNVLTLPEVRFWTCQAGVFESENNAEACKEQLMVLGYQAEILNQKPWMVFLGLGHSAADLQGLRTNLSAKGIPTVTKQIILPKRTFRVTGNGAQLTEELLSNVNDILGAGLTADALTKEKTLWDSLAGTQPSKQLAGLHQAYSQVRAKSTLEEQNTLGLSLFFESQRVINLLSGK